MPAPEGAKYLHDHKTFFFQKYNKTKRAGARSRVHNGNPHAFPGEGIPNAEGLMQRVLGGRRT